METPDAPPAVNARSPAASAAPEKVTSAAVGPPEAGQPVKLMAKGTGRVVVPTVGN